MTALAVFAKPPRVGRVKTRLIPDLGADAATRVYRRCLQHALEIAHRSGLAFEIYLSEPGKDPLLEPHAIQYQRGADLGERMHNAFAEMLQHDSDGAIIMGSDCLDFETGHIDAAARALQEHELVIQPSLDGGYTLIGCCFADAALFDRVDWSTTEVLTQTLANAQSLGYGIQLLETVRDIDTLQDMEHYPELRDLISAG